MVATVRTSLLCCLLAMPAVRASAQETAAELTETTAPAANAEPATAESATGETATAAPVRTPEQKQRARSVISLTMMVTGIALTGLLILIVAIAARGIARRLDERDTRVAGDQRREPERGTTPLPPGDLKPTSPDDGASAEQQEPA